MTDRANMQTSTDAVLGDDQPPPETDADVRHEPTSYVYSWGLTSRLHSPRFWGPIMLSAVILAWGSGFAIGFVAALTVLSVVAFAAAVLGIFWPALGLIGIGLLCTLDSVSRVFLLSGGLLRWNTFNYWLIVVAAIHLPMLLRWHDVHVRLLQAFVLLLIAELTFSPSLEAGVLHLLNLVCVFGLLVYFHRAGRYAYSWCYLGLCCGWSGALGGLTYYVQKSNLGIIDPNALAYLPVTALFTICLAFPFAEALRMGRFQLSALAAVNVCWVFLTASRGGMFVAGLCALFLLVQMRGVGRRLTLLAGVGVIAVVMVSQFSSLQEYAVHRVLKLFDDDRSAASRTSGRSDLMIGGWRIFTQNPFGVGTGGFAYHWERLDDTRGLSGFAQGIKKSAHTGWIKTLVENGIPGFILFAGFVLSFTTAGLMHRGIGRGVGLLTTGCLSAAFVSTEFQAKGLWLLAAAAMVLISGRNSAEADEN